MYKIIGLGLLFFSLLASAVTNNVSYWFAPNHYEFLLDEDRAKYFEDYNISVFQFYAGYLERLDDSTMKAEFDVLRKYNIAISIEVPPLVVPQGSNAPEGFGQKDSIKNLLVRIKKNGGDIRFFTMDEPIMAWYKKHSHSMVYSDIQDLVLAMSEVVGDIYYYFPNAQVGDVEPLDQFNGNEEQFVPAFVNYYEKIIRHPLAFIHYDVSWGKDWVPEVTLLTHLSNEKQISSGIIFNSQNSTGPTKVWMGNAEDNINRFKNLNIPNLDHVVVQSWSKYPLGITPGDAEDNNYHMYLLELLGAKVHSVK